MNAIQRVRELYRRLQQYQSSIGYIMNLGHIWQSNMDTMMRLIDTYDTPEEMIGHVDRTFLYSINFPPENADKNTGVWTSDNDVPAVRELLVDWLLDNQSRSGVDIFEMAEYVQESSLIYCKNTVYRNGRALSGNFLRTLSIWCQIGKYVKENIRDIIEVGAGCGHQARTIFLMNPAIRYTIVDIPETLCFAYVFLSTSFPDKKCLYVTSPEDLRVVDEYDIVFVPVVFADCFHGRRYDLFINTASMGEMPNEIIHYWVDYIQTKIQVKHMFVLNRFLNTVTPDLDVVMSRRQCNRSSLVYDSDWKLLNWEVEPAYARCPFVDSLHGRQLEIIASRPWGLSQEDKIARSKKLYKEVSLEDWNRIETSFNNGVMTARDNVLVLDTTMTGSLFKLWESIRLDMNSDNLRMMIKYIRSRLTHHPGRYMEEVAYYEEMLARCTGVWSDTDRNSQGSRVEQTELPHNAWPVLIEEYGKYNLVRYDGRIFALALAAGPIDLIQVDEEELAGLQAKGECLICASVPEAKQLIDQKYSQQELRGTEDSVAQVHEQTRQLPSAKGPAEGRQRTWKRKLKDVAKKFTQPIRS